MIADHHALGLPIASKIRTGKIATLDSMQATLLGRLPVETMAIVHERLGSHCGFVQNPLRSG